MSIGCVLHNNRNRYAWGNTDTTMISNDYGIEENNNGGGKV